MLTTIRLARAISHLRFATHVGCQVMASRFYLYEAPSFHALGLPVLSRSCGLSSGPPTLVQAAPTAPREQVLQRRDRLTPRWRVYTVEPSLHDHGFDFDLEQGHPPPEIFIKPGTLSFKTLKWSPRAHWIGDHPSVDIADRPTEFPPDTEAASTAAISAAADAIAEITRDDRDPHGHALPALDELASALNPFAYGWSKARYEAANRFTDECHAAFDRIA